MADFVQPVSHGTFRDVWLHSPRKSLIIRPGRIRGHVLYPTELRARGLLFNPHTEAIAEVFVPFALRRKKLGLVRATGTVIRTSTPYREGAWLGVGSG